MRRLFLEGGEMIMESSISALEMLPADDTEESGIAFYTCESTAV